MWQILAKRSFAKIAIEYSNFGAPLYFVAENAAKIGFGEIVSRLKKNPIFVRIF